MKKFIGKFIYQKTLSSGEIDDIATELKRVLRLTQVSIEKANSDEYSVYTTDMSIIDFEIKKGKNGFNVELGKCGEVDKDGHYVDAGAIRVFSSLDDIRRS